MDCLFCKIIAGEIPSQKVYEDDKVLAFKDIEPQAPFHILIIPKEHIPSAAAITSQNSSIIGYIYEIAAKLAEEYHLDGGFRLVNNCGPDAQQSVQHIHFHMLAGRLLGWPPG